MHISEFLRALIFVVMVGVVYVLEAGYWARYLWRRQRTKTVTQEASTYRRIGLYALHVIALAGLLCMAYGYFIEPYWLTVNHIRIETPEWQGRPLRLVQISDLHCDLKARNEPKLPGIINALAPDIVVFTGDSLNAEGALPVFKQTLRDINARLGKLAIKDNIDTWYWQHLDLFSGTGFEVLDCGHKAITASGDTIYLAGVSYSYADSWRQAIRGIPRDKLCVLLYHYPDLIEEVAGSGIDLYLSGHTHGGQVALPFYGALVTMARFGKKYEAGEYLVNDTTLYVNQGIGMEGGRVPRVRFLRRPEITVFDINSDT